MTITELVGSAVILILTFLLYKRKNNAEIAKTEIEVMQKALSTFKDFTEQLTERVNELTAQVNTLTNINEKLQLEVSNLESILKHKS
jgi:DNA anti-recombination protein RmuC